MILGSPQEYRLRMLRVQAPLFVLQRCRVSIPVSSLEETVGKTHMTQTQRSSSSIINAHPRLRLRSCFPIPISSDENFRRFFFFFFLSKKPHAQGAVTGLNE